MGLAWEDWERVRDNARTIDAAGAACFRTQHTSVAGVTEQRVIAKGTASLLDVLGVRIAFGRWFLPEEVGPGAPSVAVASHDYTTRR